MARPKQLDNSTFNRKRILRTLMLKSVIAAGVEPVIMETHGGAGKLFAAVYADVKRGVVFEKDEIKIATLCRQRPTWAVYEGDCVQALREGAGRHLEVNVLGLDPFGEPWGAIDAFFTSERPRAPLLHVVVNDGLRQKVRYGGAWAVKHLQPIVAKYGNQLFPRYADVCRELLTDYAAPHGYVMERWAAYYCGEMKNITHYHAAFRKEA